MSDDARGVGIEYVELKLEHLGLGGGEGSVTEEVDRLIQEMASLVNNDERYTGEASINLKLTIKKTEHGLVVDAKTKHSPPCVRRRAAHGIMTKHGLLTEKAEQLPLLGAAVVGHIKEALKDNEE